ncbi:MAG: hemerythrin domain-containing protein [Bacteroidota bacterium]
MDIFETIKNDHKTQREQGKELLNTTDPEKREKLFEQLKSLVDAHARSEERYFYIALLADDKSQGEARHSISEHHEINEMMEEVDSKDISSDEWMESYKKFHELLIHHLDEEEEEIFSVAREVLSPRQVDDLAKRYNEMMADIH